MLVAQSRPTQCDSMGCSPPGSSVHGILQARILEWVAIPFSRASPYPGIEPGSQLCLHCRQILYGLSHQGSPMKSVRGLHNTLGWSVWKLWTLSSTLEPRTRTGCRSGGQEISGGGRDETCWEGGTKLVAPRKHAGLCKQQAQQKIQGCGTEPRRHQYRNYRKGEIHKQGFLKAWGWGWGKIRRTVL